MQKRGKDLHSLNNFHRTVMNMHKSAFVIYADLVVKNLLILTDFSWGKLDGEHKLGLKSTAKI